MPQSQRAKSGLHHVPDAIVVVPARTVIGLPTVQIAVVLSSNRTSRFEMVFFPKGPAGAHQIRNDTDEGVRVLMWSTVVYPTATAYPDTDKVGVWTGDKAEDLMVLRSGSVDYFHGEAGHE